MCSTVLLAGTGLHPVLLCSRPEEIRCFANKAILNSYHTHGLLLDNKGPAVNSRRVTNDAEVFLSACSELTPGLAQVGTGPLGTGDFKKPYILLGSESNTCISSPCFLVVGVKVVLMQMPGCSNTSRM